MILKKKNNLKKFILYKGTTLKKTLILFQRNRSNFSVVLDRKQKFLGVITISDVRRALISGNNLYVKIDNFINYNPAFIKGELNQINISNLINTKKFSNAEPPIIPLINKKNELVKLLDKDSLEIYNYKKITKTVSILLIGGGGYIGTVLAKKLINLNYNVIIYDKFIYLSSSTIKKKINSKKLKLIDGDTRDVGKIFSAIKNSEVVIHLAEMVGDPLCEKKPEKTFEINFLASITIANICKNLGISKFIYLSSCSVYGEKKKRSLLTETSKINPLSTYAKLKDLCEKSLIKNSGTNFQPCIVRLGTVYGDSIRPRFDLVINLFCGLIANNKKITIQGGKQWRPFIHVEDVARALIRIVRAKQKRINGKVFNIAGENFTLDQIGDLIRKKYPKIKIEYHNGKDERDYKVSSKKIMKTLRFRFKKKLNLELGTYIKIIKKKQIKNIFSGKYINVFNLNKFIK